MQSAFQPFNSDKAQNDISAWMSNLINRRTDVGKRRAGLKTLIRNRRRLLEQCQKQEDKKRVQRELDAYKDAFRSCGRLRDAAQNALDDTFKDLCLTADSQQGCQWTAVPRTKLVEDGGTV
jgi:hypothetical protein